MMLRLAAAAAVLSSLVSVAFASDPLFPQFGNAKIDVRNYDLRLSVTPNGDTKLYADAVLTIVAVETVTSISLDLHGLTVEKTLVNGVARPFTRPKNKLVVQLAQPLSAGEEVTLRVRYRGNPSPILAPIEEGFGSFRHGWRQFGSAIYVVGEPVSALTWFPANETPADPATFRFRISVPKPMKAAANGWRGEVVDLGKRRRYTFTMGRPMATWRATVHVNRFRVFTERSTSGVPVRLYASPGLADTKVPSFMRATKMMNVFEKWFGPYPYATYGMVTIDDERMPFALETQTLSVFSRKSGYPKVVAHELAHQWFGNSLSVRSWKDIWLAEGFATYVHLKWLFQDIKQFHWAMEGIYQEVRTKKLGPVVVSSKEDMFTDITYYRGAAALYALQRKIGDARMMSLLKDWASSRRHKLVTTEDFLGFVGTWTGDPEAVAVLRAWIYDDLPPAIAGIPDSTVASLDRSLMADPHGHHWPPSPGR